MGSLVVTKLKWFITESIEPLFAVEISTMIVANTASIWWIEILKAIILNLRKGLINALKKAFEFLRKNATCSHPNRE